LDGGGDEGKEMGYLIFFWDLFLLKFLLKLMKK